MIAQKEAHKQAQSWEKQLSHAITDPNKLLKQLAIKDEKSDKIRQIQAHQQFKTLVPVSFLRRMKPGDQQDPLLQQVLPIAQEQANVPGYGLDPLAERDHNPIPGLLHKFYGRVLIIAAAGCAINCRYCFRRHFPYQENQLGHRQWDEIFQYIDSDTSIKEVILSGGDPLLLKDKKLLEISNRLAQIKHVKILRIHTRIPIVLPDRINNQLLKVFEQVPLKLTMVMHCNHGQEIDNAVKHATQRLVASGITLLNQSVLLKGINDNAQALIELSETLFDAGILPYYLNMLDKVKGAHHFYVDDKIAQALLKELKRQLPGYLVPRLVREIANHPYKYTVEAGE